MQLYTQLQTTQELKHCKMYVLINTTTSFSTTRDFHYFWGNQKIQYFTKYSQT